MQEPITKEYVQLRIDDWKQRVYKLYAAIKDWTQDYSGNYSFKQSDIRMYEELMKNVDIPPTYLKTLEIYRDGELVAIVKPIGLWVIGANGRVDILHKNGGATLADKSEKDQESNWLAYTRGAKAYVPFNQDFFSNMLFKKAA